MELISFSILNYTFRSTPICSSLSNLASGNNVHIPWALQCKCTHQECVTFTSISGSHQYRFLNLAEVPLKWLLFENVNHSGAEQQQGEFKIVTTSAFPPLDYHNLWIIWWRDSEQIWHIGNKWLPKLVQSMKETLHVLCCSQGQQETSNLKIKNINMNTLSLKLYFSIQCLWLSYGIQYSDTMTLFSQCGRIYIIRSTLYVVCICLFTLVPSFNSCKWSSTLKFISLISMQCFLICS